MYHIYYQIVGVSIELDSMSCRLRIALYSSSVVYRFLIFVAVVQQVAAVMYNESFFVVVVVGVYTFLMSTRVGKANVAT